MELSTIRVLYPTFDSIFDRRVKDAKFDSVPVKSRDFRALKMGVISLWHLQGEYRRIRPETRSALIQTLVIEHDFQRAFQLFKHEMKNVAAQVPDSQFLRQLEDCNDEHLRPAAQNAKALVQTELSSSIDTLVQTITQDVLAMRQDLNWRQVQLQVANKEREALQTALVDFIRDVNQRPAKGKDW